MDQGPPHKWKTFVANRVAQIQTLTKSEHWQHVTSANNPADLISRGVEPHKLNESNLWWHGPNFLLKSFELNPPNVDNTFVPEQRTIISMKVENTTVALDIFNKYSDLFKLVNVVGYCLRFINNCRHRVQSRKHSAAIGTSLSNSLISKERENALTTIIKLCQQESFSLEIEALSTKRALNKRSSILRLSAFLDDNNLLRVGGRLKHADMSFGSKHQILLPQRHSLTTLIMKRLHILNLHCGPQQLLYLTREKYWPITGISVAKDC